MSIVNSNLVNYRASGVFRDSLLTVLFIEALRFLSCKERGPLLCLEMHKICIINGYISRWKRLALKIQDGLR